MPPGSGDYGGQLYPLGYPVPGTVYRDATMNPQYPVRTPGVYGSSTTAYNSTMAGLMSATAGPAGLATGASGQLASRPWTTAASSTAPAAAVHQPRAATATS